MPFTAHNQKLNKKITHAGGVGTLRTAFLQLFVGIDM
jgi:hypothetical protein